MIKKLFFLLSFIISSALFAQSNDESVVSSNNQQPTKSITNLAAAPNPFTSKAIISFNSDKEQPILLEVKNVLGRSVFSIKTIALSGKNEIPFQKENLPTGMYIYTIQTNSEIISKRFVIK